MAEVPAATPAPLPTSKKSLKAAHHLTSGALSGLTSAVCLQPLDLLKTRLQQGYNVGRKRCAFHLGAWLCRADNLTAVTGSAPSCGKSCAMTVSLVFGGEQCRPWRGELLGAGDLDGGVGGGWMNPPTNAADGRNVPGVALYFYMLSAIRAELALVPWFARASTASTSDGRRSALTQLSSTGNLVAGSVARTSVGFVLNPITVIKARFEVSLGMRLAPGRCHALVRLNANPSEQH